MNDSEIIEFNVGATIIAATTNETLKKLQI